MTRLLGTREQLSVGMEAYVVHHIGMTLLATPKASREYHRDFWGEFTVGFNGDLDISG